MIKNSSDPYIQQLAESISSLYSESIIPLELIVDDEEIQLFYDDYGNAFDGMTFYDSSFFMHLNLERGNKPNSTRGRFTLAHELGHYFIDNHRIGLMSGYLNPHPSKVSLQRKDKIEREADYFAACILMPQKAIEADVKGKKFNFSVLQFIKDKYNVSLTAAAFRFKDVGNHPIMIIYAINQQIKWNFCSTDFPYKYLAENKPKIPENTLMDKCFKKKSSPNKTEEIWAIEWFNYVSNDSLQKKFHEHCIMFEDHALSIIW